MGDLDVQALLSLWLGLENRLSTLLGLYFTVNIAVIGWVVSRQEVMNRKSKVLSALSYGLFAGIILSDLIQTFRSAEQVNCLVAKWPGEFTLGLPHIPGRMWVALSVYTIGVLIVLYAIVTQKTSPSKSPHNDFRGKKTAEQGA